MRLYETSDVNFYNDVRNRWDLYCRYGPNKTWKPRIRKEALPKRMQCYHDLETKYKERIEDKDLHFKTWPPSRIDPKACLPIFYAAGGRFIKLQWEKPLSFRCRTFPMNLKEVRVLNAEMRAKRLREKERRRFEKAIFDECVKKGCVIKEGRLISGFERDDRTLKQNGFNHGVAGFFQHTLPEDGEKGRMPLKY